MSHHKLQGEEQFAHQLLVDNPTSGGIGTCKEGAPSTAPGAVDIFHEKNSKTDSRNSDSEKGVTYHVHFKLFMAPRQQANSKVWC